MAVHSEHDVTLRAAQIVARMERHGRSSDATSLYPGVGHRLLGAAAQAQSSAPGTVAFDYGGTDEADARAREDAWRQAGRFLRRHLT